MTILVLGASGLLGGELYRQLSATGATVIGTYYQHAQPGLQQLTLTDQAAVAALFAATKPEQVYLAAARANVDWCQANPAEAWALNVGGTATIAAACREHAARLVFYSSDYVFAGDNGPYAEDAVPAPINVYGQHKLLAEQLIGQNDPNALIVRTTGVYGAEQQRKNFVYRVIDTLRRGEVLRIPIDQWGNPTFAPELAAASIALLQTAPGGVYHLVGSQYVHRFMFAQAIASAFDLPLDLIEPLTTDTLGQTAPRPLQAGLRGEHANQHIAWQPQPYEQSLSALRQQLAKDV